MVAHRGPDSDTLPGSALPHVHEAWLPREHALYRPRHGRHQRISLIVAAIFFCTPLVAQILGVRPPEIENHRLADFPSPGDGWAFFTGMSQWATDQLAFRDAAITADDRISRGMFGEPPPFDRPQPQQRTESPLGPIAPPTSGPSEPRPPATGGFTRVIEGKDGWLYFGDEMQWKCQPNQPLDQVMGELGKFRQAVEASGRRFVLVVAPDKSTAVPAKLPNTYAGQACASALRSQFWDRVVAEAGAIDLRGPLREEARQIRHEPYFSQDTHWTYEGGLVLTRQLADAISPGASGTWKVTPAGTWHGNADLPPLVGRSAELSGQDYGLAPDGSNDRTNRTNSDFRVPLHMSSQPTTGTIANQVGMFADSYTEFASPFLGAVFNDITIMHLENARRDMALAGQIVKNSDVVVVEVVERHLSTGLSQITDPVFVAEMSKALAANPRR